MARTRNTEMIVKGTATIVAGLAASGVSPSDIPGLIKDVAKALREAADADASEKA